MSDRVELAGYEIEGLIGRGTTGEVYLATHSLLNRKVALKRLTTTARIDPEWVERFVWEGRSMAQLQHPHVVQIYDIMAVGGELFLVMEYVAGVALRALRDRSLISRPSALLVISQLSSAIAYANGQGIVHRDVKPANVLVTTDGCCKLTDFGVAKWLVETEHARRFPTRSGTLLGTPNYMSPEAASGLTVLDGRADLYSLAVISYELLTGRLPFDEGEDPVAVLEAHVSGSAIEPRSFLPDFPAPVERALLRGLEKDPGRRPADAALFWSELQNAASTSWPGWLTRVDLGDVVAQIAGRGESVGSGSTGTTVEPRTRGTARPNADATVVQHRVAVRPISRQDASSSEVPPPLSHSADQATVVVKIRPRPGRRKVLGLIAAVVCGIAIGLSMLLVVRKVFQASTSHLDVQSVVVSVEPKTAVGHCPDADYSFAAKIATNGAEGTIVSDWTTPTSDVTPVSKTSVSFGTGIVSAHLLFTFSGSSPATGLATFHILRPRKISSRPLAVRYLCP